MGNSDVREAFRRYRTMDRQDTEVRFVLASSFLYVRSD